MTSREATARYRAKNPNKVRAWNAIHRAKNREQYNANRTAAQRALRARIAEIKLAAGCIDCGYWEHAEALDFDHRPGEEKVRNVSQMTSNASWERIVAEIAKCDVVCANCHRVRTARRRQELE